MIRSLLNIPWLVCGRDHRGIDCLGLVVMFMREAGVPMEDPLTTSPDDVVNHAVCDQFQRVFSADFGDVIHFGEHDENHLGIATFTGILNATKRHGSIITKWTHAAKHVKGVYRSKALC